MSILTELYIFEMKDKESRNVWWRNVQEGKPIPYTFARSFLLSLDVSILGIAVFIAITTQGSVVTKIGLELLFIGIYALLIRARSTQQFWRVTALYLAAIVLAAILNLVLPGNWGCILLYMLCITVFYRFPLRYAVSLAVLFICTIVTTDGVLLHLPSQLGIVVLNVAAACSLCWLGWTRRTQYLLVVKLQETQEQLREQMVRSEVMAAERERTRIARDIHDVLSHSLAVLSIQVQAARHLRTRDTERQAAKLDEMVILIRESIAESRRVVGLLREEPTASTVQDELGVKLKSMALTFNERTGIHCFFEEHGTPHAVSQQQQETIHLALREMMTNAHRHGSAKTLWITLQWQETHMLLEVHDDGMGMHGTQTVLQETGGHHGLQGMRERAIALGGTVDAEPCETGGFTVRMSLPYEFSNHNTTTAGSTV